MSTLGPIIKIYLAINQSKKKGKHPGRMETRDGTHSVDSIIMENLCVGLKITVIMPTRGTGMILWTQMQHGRDTCAQNVLSGREINQSCQ